MDNIGPEVIGYKKIINGITLVYLPNIYGYRILKLTFNLGKLLHHDNIASVWSCNLMQVQQLLNIALKGIINLNDFGYIGKWKVYEYECFVDFIIPQYDMDAWLNVISKCSLPYKNVDNNLLEKGTVYFYSGRSLETSNSQVTIYNKIKEKHDKAEQNEIPRIDYHNSDLINLPLGYRILRLEISHNKDPIQRKNKRVVIGRSNNINTTDLIDTDFFKREHCFYTLEELFNYNRQLRDIDTVVSDLKLHYQVTTTRKLIHKVKALGLGSRLTANIITTIKSINNPKRYGAVLNTDTIKDHKNTILTTGYHYITSTRDLTPLNIEKDAIGMLTQHQLNMIQRYPKNNIYRDTLF